jgi:hypothetical protein
MAGVRPLRRLGQWGRKVGAAHKVKVEAAGGAYQDFIRAKRIPLALRDGAKDARLLSANGMRPSAVA